MATYSAHQSTECSICLSLFRTPKALPCLHTFCHDCLQCYVNNTFNPQDESFPCPICRAVCRPDLFKNGSTIPVKEIVTHLPTNFHINLEAKHKVNIPDTKPAQTPLDNSYLNNIDCLEKQIYDYKMQIEQQYRRNMIWAHTLKQGIKFCPKDNHSDGSLENRLQIALKKEYNLAQENHDSLDKFLLDLEKHREDTIRLIIPHNQEASHHNRKRIKRQNKSKTSGNEEVDSFEVRLNLTAFKSNLERTFEQLTISENQNELKTLVNQMQLLWANPDKEGPAKPSLFLKIANQDSNGHAFPKADEFLYICSVKVMVDDTVVVCGKSPNLLLCYDANSGLMKSRFELCDEPSNMSVFNDTDVMVTFLNEMSIDIINVSSHPPIMVKKIATKMLYFQVLCLDNDTKKILALSALYKKNRTYAYHVLQFSTESDSEVLNTGRIPDLYPGSRLAYIKQRDIVLYPDTSGKCLLGLCLSSKEIVFKYYGDTENPVVLISDICCSDSFIFISDRKHHKVHKLSFNGTKLDIIKCHDFDIMWPLHLHVNRCRTMVICSQRKDTSYDFKTFLI